MNVIVRVLTQADLSAATAVWNEIVAQGEAFPQETLLSESEAEAFFASQTVTSVAELDGCVVGCSILHPNLPGRCGHIANASYPVSAVARGHGVGEALVRDSLDQARRSGFRVLQFNAVVADNVAALRRYEKLGFARLGTIPGGFRRDDGTYADIVPHYKALDRGH